MEQVIFLDLTEGIKMFTSYRDSLLTYLSENSEFTETVTTGDNEEIKTYFNRLTTIKLKKIVEEIKDASAALEGLIMLRNFYQGGTIPWEIIPPNFFELLQIEIPVPRPEEISIFNLEE